MARKLLRKYLPSPQRFGQERGLKLFKRILHQPNLWHLNRHSVARACAVGFFWTCVPVPFQMLPTAICSVWFRANLAVALLLTWLSNPITMGPQIYANYRLGRWLLRQPPGPDFQPTSEWLWAHLAHAWLPLLLGVAISATVVSAGSYFAAQILWRWHVTRALRHRTARRIGQRCEPAPSSS